MANIFQNLIRAPRSVADYSADIDRNEMAGLQLEGQRGQNALVALTRQQQAQQAQQAMRENNALQRIAQESGGDPQRMIGGLRGSGLPGLMTRADALEKQALDKQKIGADVGKTDAETAAKIAETRYAALDRHARNLGMVQTPEDLVAYADTTLDILGAQGPQREQARQQMLAKAQQLGLEQWKQAAAQQAVPLLEKFKEDAQNKRAQLQADTTTRGQDMSSQTQMRGQDISARTAREGHSITARGQNMADARARESTSATMSKPFEVTGPDGLPMLVQQDKQGNIAPVQGFGPKSGSSKPLNDTQSKALLFGTRAQEAHKVLESIAGKYSPAAVNAKLGAENMPLIGGAAGMVGNAMLSAEGQQAEQAQRDFVNAVLRRESGAVISESEFQNARKQYFPQPNDKASTLAQKKRNRELAISGFLAEVPEGRRTSITPKGGVSGGWSVEEVK